MDQPSNMKLPYHPRTWLDRTEALRQRGYLELAVGDAYKAVKLAKSILSVSRRHGANIGYGMGFCILSQGLSPRAINHAQELVKEALDLLRQCLVDVDCYSDAHQLLQSDDMERLTTHRACQDAGAGSYVLRRYYWMDNEHFSRSKDVLTQVNEELRSTPCKVGFSKIPTTPEAGSNNWEVSIDWDTSESVHGSTENSRPDAMLGLFATRDIREGETILVDKTDVSAKRVLCDTDCHHCLIDLPKPSAEGSENSLDSILCSGSPYLPGTRRRCSAVYCSTTCQSAARDSHHSIMCGKDFTWAQGLMISDKILLQVLAYCVQHGCHPLDHPTVTRLTPQYGVKRYVSLFDTIEEPIEMLLELGVDIFVDQRFDTWVLIMLKARIDNNKWGKNTNDKEMAAVRSDNSWLQNLAY